MPYFFRAKHTLKKLAILSQDSNVEPIDVFSSFTALEEIHTSWFFLVHDRDSCDLDGVLPASVRILTIYGSFKYDLYLPEVMIRSLISCKTHSLPHLRMLSIMGDLSPGRSEQPKLDRSTKNECENAGMQLVVWDGQHWTVGSSGFD